jgi:hypothetical protein
MFRLNIGYRGKLLGLTQAFVGFELRHDLLGELLDERQ